MLVRSFHSPLFLDAPVVVAAVVVVAAALLLAEERERYVNVEREEMKDDEVT